LQLCTKKVYSFFELFALLVFAIAKEFVLLLELFVGLSNKLFFLSDGFDFLLELGYLELSLFKIVFELFLIGSTGDVVHQLVKIVHYTVLL